MGEKILRILIVDSLSMYKIEPTIELTEVIYKSLTSNYGSMYFLDGKFSVTETTTTNLSETILYVESTETNDFIRIKDIVSFEDIEPDAEKASLQLGVPYNRLLGEINPKPPEYSHILEKFYTEKLSYIIGFMSSHTKIQYIKESKTADYFEEKIRAFVESKLGV